MISHIQGEVLSVGLDHTVISNGGVGFRVQATADTLATLHRGDQGGLHTSLVVREDSLTLYGFGTVEERDFFEVVQSVSGIGPRLALALLGVLSPGETATAVMNDDPKTLQKVPGVGPKVAQRMVLELQNKVAAFADEQQVRGSTPVTHSAVAQQVVQGLVGLGYQEKAAEQAVQKILASSPQPPTDTATLLRSALQLLSGGKV